MTDREKLHYLIKEYIKGSYPCSEFCDEFTVQYDIKTDYTTLSDEENECFNVLSEISARFSDDNEDLKIPNVYFAKKHLDAKINEIVNRLKIII